MDTKQSGPVSSSSATSTPQADPQRPGSGDADGRPYESGVNMTDPSRNVGDDDDEEEEGMLKVDEEGQIEDDRADLQVSHSRPSNEGRSISLADRLKPHPDSSLKKAGSGPQPSSTNAGYISPRHASLERERDRDRYSEVSSGASSSYVPSRSRFGYSSEPSASYGTATAYAYPSNHREPVRAEPFAASSRASFSGASSRAENRRGWYSPSGSTRGPDTYRPGAIRERDRELETRDWDSFRDSDRDREWAASTRDRDRESYRDLMDKRRDWPGRERSTLPSDYDIADSHPPYPPSGNGKYGFDGREFHSRRPASPPAHLGRDREYNGDRSRDWDRDRSSEGDQRIRAPSSGWGAGTGMRQWGKASDAGGDPRSGRRPASEDARSETSSRQPASRSNNTPPPAASSERSSKLVGSDVASERSEARSRDFSPQQPQSPKLESTLDLAAKSCLSAPPDQSQESVDAPELVQQISTNVEQESKEGVSRQESQAAQHETDGTENSVSAALIDPTQSAKPYLGSPKLTQNPLPANDAAPTELVTPAHPVDSIEQAPAATAESAPVGAEKAAEDLSRQDAEHSSLSGGSDTQQVMVAEEISKEAPTLPPSSPEKELSFATEAKPEASPAAARVPTAEDGIASQAKADTPVQAPASLSGPDSIATAEAKALEGDEAARAVPADVVRADETLPSLATLEDEAMEDTNKGVKQTSDVASAAIQEAAASEPAGAGLKATHVQTIMDAPAIDDKNAANEGAASSADADLSAPADATSLRTSDLMGSAAPEAAAVQKPVLDAVEPMESAIALDAVDTIGKARQMEEESIKTEEPNLNPIAAVADLAPAAGPFAQSEKHQQSESGVAVDLRQREEPTESTTTDRAPPKGQIQPAQADDSKHPSGPNDTTVLQPVATEKAQQKDSTPLAPEPETAQSARSQAFGRDDTVIEQRDAIGDGTDARPIEANIKVEEVPAAPSSDIAMVDVSAESKQNDEPEEDVQVERQTEQPSTARAATETATAGLDFAPTVSAVEAAAVEPDTLQAESSRIQVSGPHVTATIDKEKQSNEISLPQIDYGDDNEAQALMRQESARIEEVEMPAVDQQGPSLRIAEIDIPAKEIEPPLMTPTTQEQVEHAIRSAVRQHIANGSVLQDDWKRILRENQRISQRTTMDVLKAKIHGIPQIVSSEQPLWLEQDDKQTERIKAQLFDQLLDRKKRLNEKVQRLKQRYRSINEEWKLHCSRLDRIAERREMLRRPPVNTPAGTPGGFGAEDPPPGGGGSGLLGTPLTTGRANRRGAQAGFAGFGDAVRSEAEFLEILASLENADMQDPNMRAARTTATAPDMFIDPDSDHLMKRSYDDVNGFVADPLRFYLDEFDPDVWSEEEKAIFARRYALWPKQFGKIAQALPHKTPSQCVRYYYLNKKVPGNDFKALAAARNRERKRKTRVKPKKAKGSALMADLKSAKGEEVDDVEDGSGMRSPMDATDPSGAVADLLVPSNGRKGGRSRMVPPAIEGVTASTTEETSTGRKRPADESDAEVAGAEAKVPDKKRSGTKSKRAKSDNASGSDKARKPRTSLKKDSAAIDEAKAAVPPVPANLPSPAKQEAADAQTRVSVAAVENALDTTVASAQAKSRVEDSDLAAAEALGALAGLFGGAAQGGVAAATAPTSQPASGSDITSASVDAGADGRKPGKKRRSKTSVPGEEGADVTGKGRGKQPTSSYWSVAERFEFLRALVVHGPRWEVVSSTLAQKSAAQARNYFARNEDEVDFADAAALSRRHAELPLAEREAAALAFVRHRFASNSGAAGGPAPSTGGASMPLSLAGSSFADAPSAASYTTHLPPTPVITASQADIAEAKVQEDSPEPPIHRRGLQINSLLNDSNDAGSNGSKRRSSLHEWQAGRDEPSHYAMGRDASVPPAFHAKQAADLERRPVTADRVDAVRPVSSEGMSKREDYDERARAYERYESHTPAVDHRDAREEGSDSRSWMYDSSYEARRRSSPSPVHAAMAPPSHAAEHGMSVPRYPTPLSNVSGPGHISRALPLMSSRLLPSEEADVERERERARYSMYGAPSRSREHESHSMPPSVPSVDQLSPTSAAFGASHGYSRYAAAGVGSMYPSTAAASTALASRGRPTSGPLTAPLPTASERPAYEQRWQRYSQSPGPSVSSTSSAAGASHASAAVGAYSAGSAYRSSHSPYSSFPSQSLPRPSLPSLSAGAGKVGAPHLPSLGAAGRSLPPILGTFPAPGRGSGSGSRSVGPGEEARYWPYPPRPRSHDQAPPGRSPE